MVLVLLLLIALTPVGVHAAYDGALTVRLLIGPFRLTLYPPKATEEGKPPPKKREKKEKPKKAKEKKPFPRPNRQQIRYSLQVLPPLLKKAVGRTRRRILLAPLRALVVFGGEDPADVAELYGKAQAVLSTVYPALKRLVRVREDAVNLYTDYDSETIFFRGEIGVRIRIGDVAIIGISAAAGLVKWLIGYRRRADKLEKRTIEKKDQQAHAA